MPPNEARPEVMRGGGRTDKGGILGTSEAGFEAEPLRYQKGSASNKKV